MPTGQGHITRIYFVSDGQWMTEITSKEFIIVKQIKGNHSKRSWSYCLQYRQRLTKVMENNSVSMYDKVNESESLQSLIIKP